MISLSSFVAIVAFLFIVPSANADTVYRWVDAEGQLQFSNRVERIPPGAKVASPPPIGRIGARHIPNKAVPPRSVHPHRDRASEKPTTYRWVDAEGQLQFSNRGDRIPPGAKVASPPPIGRIGVRRTPPPRPRRSIHLRRDGASEKPIACGPGDPTGVAEAMRSRLRDAGMSDSALFVNGVPVEEPVAGGVTRWASFVAQSRPIVHQAAVAFPEDRPCPSQPPLDRYAVREARRDSGSGLCDDYARAIAPYDVSIGRNRPVAQDFCEMADKFQRIADEGYRTRGEPFAVTVQAVAASPAVYYPAAVGWASDDISPVALPPWLVEAHIAQLRELCAETDAYADELDAAIQEISRAGRAAGCW